MGKIWNVLANGERYQTVAAIVAILSLVWFFGCETEVPSVQNPEVKVCAPELEAELAMVLSKYEKRFRDIDRIDQFKALAFQQGQTLAAGGALNLPGLIGTVAAILGVGAIVDNTRKRAEIKKLRETLSSNST
jgi:hypothetical protein